ncbi:hypothetical protein BN1723_010950, partial [Verticillium longisporum]
MATQMKYKWNIHSLLSASNENLLKWGGSRDAWRCLSDTLQDERLKEGDEKAMAIVGSWGIKDDHH